MKTPIQKVQDRLLKVKTILENTAVCMAKNDFVEKFILCEIAYKTLLREYKISRNERYTEEKLTINMKQISSVLRFFSIQIESNILSHIFSSKEKRRGQKSAKLLRNGIVHSLDAGDMLEVFRRQNELQSYMNSFLYVFLPTTATQVEEPKTVA